jgi:signal transduction histidine kinase
MEPSAGNESRNLFELAPIIHSLVELECEGKRNDIRIYVTASSEPHLTADRRLFQRVMENLLRNALRYAQSSIVIEAASFEKTVNIEVRDDGPGISQEHRAKGSSLLFASMRPP